MQAEPARTLPHSEETERAILSVALMTPEQVETIAGLLTSPEVWYLERHQLIWEAVQVIAGRKDPVDLRTVEAELQARGHFDQVGGMAYLAGLDLDLPIGGLERVREYCEILLERWARRRLIALGIAMRDGAAGSSGSEEVITTASAEMDAIARDRATAASEGVELGDLLVDFDPWQAVESRAVPTGLIDLDEKLGGGLRPGELIVVAARPGQGKSSFALGVARAAAAAGQRVRLHTLEMTAEALRDRLVAAESGVPARQIKARQMTEPERNRTMKAAISLGSIGERLHIDPTPMLSMGQIGAAAALDRLRHGLGLLIIDSLSLVRLERGDAYRLQLGAAAAAAKSMAKTLDVPVLLLHHLSRQHEHDGRAPALRDLRESGDIEAHADVVVFIYRPEVYLSADDPELADMRGLALFLVSKQREGPIGQVEAAWLGEIAAFRNLTRQREPGTQKAVPF